MSGGGSRLRTLIPALITLGTGAALLVTIVQAGVSPGSSVPVEQTSPPAPPLHAMERGSGGEVRAAATPRTITFAYDANGRLTRVNYGGGSSIGYGYDSNGNLTSINQVGSATTPTPTATTTPGPGTPTVTPGPGTPSAVATIAPTPGATQVVPLPNGRGTLVVPGNAGGTTPLITSIRVVSAPVSLPVSVTVLAALEISFTDAGSSAAVPDLEQDATIEVSYAGLGLSETQLDQLAIYNASRGEFLFTTVDRTRQVASAKTRRFSVFTLALVTGPVPRLFTPVVLTQFGGGW